MHNAQAQPALPQVLTMQLVAAQRRMMRKRNRAAKRFNKSTAYANVGLNGTRAVARRLRQIEAGSLGTCNGLVS